MKTYSQHRYCLLCPVVHCEGGFEAVGENEFVPCPVCGTYFVTVKTGSKLKLEAVEQALVC